MDSLLNEAPIIIKPITNIEPNIINLEGTNNTRNLNYLKSKNNKIVKINSLFRSDNLDEISYKDINKLKEELNINILIDLRNEKEIKNDKIYKLFSNYKNFSTNLEELLQTELLLGLLDEDEDENDEEYESGDEEFLNELGDIYKKVHGTFLDICSDQISLALKTIINSNGKPVMIFSNFGKDRTGVIVTILLLLLEVEKDDIVNDYIFSNKSFQSILDKNIDENNIINVLDQIKNHIPSENLDLNILNGENYLKEDIGDIKSVLLAKKANIENIINIINEEYNSIEEYAKTKLDISQDEINKLRNNYLEEYEKPKNKYVII